MAVRREPRPLGLRRTTLAPATPRGIDCSQSVPKRLPKRLPPKRGNNLGTEPPEYPRKRPITTEQKARRVNNLAPSGQSAKPPSRFNSGRRLHFPTYTHSGTYAVLLRVPVLRFWNTWERSAFEPLDRLPMRPICCRSLKTDQPDAVLLTEN